MDSRAGQTAALFKGSPDQSRGTALLFTHFYLPTLGLELPKQEYLLFLLLKANGFLQVAWQVTYDPPLPPRNGLLSFPSHRLSHSPLLPLILSTRSNFSDPDSSARPLGALLSRVGREPLASILQCAAPLPVFFTKPQALQISRSPWRVAGICGTPPMFWATKGLQKKTALNLSSFCRLQITCQV